VSVKKANKTDNLSFDVDVVKKFIIDNPDAKIYLGCDSVRVKKKRVRYATVVCIHYAGHRGAKIFGNITYGIVQDAKLNRPINRMLEEVNHIVEMYELLEEVLVERIDDVGIHLDINPKKSEGSSIAHGAARGIIQSMIGVEPEFKPDAWAASYCSDRYANACS